MVSSLARGVTKSMPKQVDTTRRHRFNQNCDSRVEPKLQSYIAVAVGDATSLQNKVLNTSGAYSATGDEVDKPESHIMLLSRQPGTNIKPST
jgi:hypothetical protein